MNIQVETIPGSEVCLISTSSDTVSNAYVTKIETTIGEDEETDEETDDLSYSRRISYTESTLANDNEQIDRFADFTLQRCADNERLECVPSLEKRRLFPKDPCLLCNVRSESSSDTSRDHSEDPIFSSTDASESLSSVSGDELHIPTELHHTLLRDIMVPRYSNENRFPIPPNTSSTLWDPQQVSIAGHLIPCHTPFSPDPRSQARGRHNKRPSESLRASDVCQPASTTKPASLFESLDRDTLRTRRESYDEGIDTRWWVRTRPTRSTRSHRNYGSPFDSSDDDDLEPHLRSPCLATVRHNSLGRVTTRGRIRPNGRTVDHYTANDKIYLHDLRLRGDAKAVHVVDIHLRAWLSNVDKWGWQCLMLPIFLHLSPADFLASFSFTSWASDEQFRFEFDTTYLQSVKHVDGNQVYAKFDCSDDLLLRWRPKQKPVVPPPSPSRVEARLPTPRQDGIQVHDLDRVDIGPRGISPSTPLAASTVTSPAVMESQIHVSTSPYGMSDVAQQFEQPWSHPSGILSGEAILRPECPPPPMASTHGSYDDVNDRLRGRPQNSQEPHEGIEVEEIMSSSETRESDAAECRKGTTQRSSLLWKDVATALGADDLDWRRESLRPFSGAHGSGLIPPTQRQGRKRFAIAFNILSWWCICFLLMIWGRWSQAVMPSVGSAVIHKFRALPMPVSHNIRPCQNIFALNVIGMNLTSWGEWLCWQDDAPEAALQHFGVREDAGQSSRLQVPVVEEARIDTLEGPSLAQTDARPWSDRLRDHFDRSLGWRADGL